VKKIVVILATIIVLSIALYLLAWSGYISHLTIPLNTQYTQGFSDTKFYKVQFGMSESQVKKILGEPFEIWEPGYTCWRYSKSDWRGDLFGYRSVQVCFDETQKVVGLTDNIF
jgi:hypothetical protein